MRDVRIITDSKTRRSKGIAYVEFWEVEAVPLVCFCIFFFLNCLQFVILGTRIKRTETDRRATCYSTNAGGTESRI